MDNPDLIAGVVVLAAALSFVNHKLTRLPHAIGLTVLGAVVSLGTVGVDLVLPSLQLRATLDHALGRLDFNRTLMTGMLSFLLFSGAVQLDSKELDAGRRPILILSIAGVIISTLATGYLFYLAARLLGTPLPLPWCMMFGALISPTDPVAVIAILRGAGVPLDVETRVAGESLFNDGIGVVMFSITYTSAVEHRDVSFPAALQMFTVEALGGALFGLAIGWIAYRSLKAVDDPPIETMITLALVMGGYTLAARLGFSPVVAMAVAGVVIGALGMPHGLTERSRAYVLGFWQTVDELLNSLLFLLIGLEVIVVLGAAALLPLALIAIPIVLLARALSVGLPMELVSLVARVNKKSYPIYVWGGLRGGIPIALALSLPNEANTRILVTATYCVVVFSLVVQGGTLKYLARRVYGTADVTPPGPT